MRCPRCAVDNPDGARFCTECGAGLTLDCPACGAPVQPGHKFCPACGHRLAASAAPDAAAPRSPPPAPALPEGERRQVTVLFADLCGFTALGSTLDPEETHALLNRYFACADGIVRRFGGSIDKHIGDGVMAVFGAPVAHGNDAERALRAAEAIHREVAALDPPLRVHVGVASGQVVASTTGSDAHREYTVTGDSVNLAARLLDRAGPGETLVSDAVQREVGEIARWQAMENLEVRGLARPVRAWRLLELEAEGRRATTGRRLVGRRRELRQFEGIVEDCRETGQGQTVYVRGEAGIGKTRLVEEFEAIVRRAGFACHAGLVLDFGIGAGQDAVRALVRSLLAVPLNADGPSRVAAAERALADGLVTGERRAHLNDLLDLPQPVELRALYDAMDNAARNLGRRQTVAELVRRLSADRPLLLKVEDLHWADRAVLDHLAALAVAVAGCPAILVMTSRVEGDPLDEAWRGQTRESPPVTIDLGPLREQEALALAGGFLDARSRFALACIERAQGNPLFLEQLLRSAEESTRADGGGVPGSIQSLVLARMDRLDPADRRALQAASVLGQRFAPEALRHLIDDPGYGCTGLVRHYLVRPEGEGFLFAHALIWEGVYGSLLTTRKRELHGRAAAWFAGRDPLLHAEHLDRAGDPAAPRAYLAAARAETAAYHTERALELAERGLVLARERADVGALLCFKGEVLHDGGAIPESLAAYERALELAGDDAERCRAWLGLAAGMRMTDRLDEAFAALDRAEAAATAHGLTAELARIHHLRGNLCFPLGRLAECLREHERALDAARRAGSAELEARALGGLGDAHYALGHMATAYGHFSRCVELARAHGLGRIEVANLPMAGLARFYGNDLRGALEDGLAAVAAAAKVGHHRAEIIARHLVYFASFMMAGAATAWEHAEAALVLSRRLGARRFESECLLFLADVDGAVGRRAEALGRLREALAISRETGMDYIGPMILGALAHATTDPEERRSALTEGEALLAAGSLSHNHYWFYWDAIEACRGAGDWDGAERYAGALEDYTRPEPLPWADFVIARARALAAHGRGGGGDAAVRELRRLRDEAERVGLGLALPALDAALGGARPPAAAEATAGVASCRGSAA